MSVYFVAHIKVEDLSEYEKYLNKCDEIFSRFDGKYLAVDESPEVVEGTFNYTRFVIIEFPDKASFEKWYKSDEYQKILKHRLSGAHCDSVLVQGQSDL